MKTYTIIIEQTNTGYSAYAPDLPGCITVGETKKEIIKNMREAIDLYLEELKNDGTPFPDAKTNAETITV